MIWLIEHILGIGLTETIATILMVLSIVCVFVCKFIPFSNVKIIKLVSYATFIVSVWLMGVLYTAAEYNDRIKELNHQIELLESKSNNVNVVVQQQVITKVERVKEYVYANQQFVDQISDTLDSNCKLTNGAVSVFNASASNKAISPSPSDFDGSPANVKASELLTTTVDNFGICYEMREKLLGWQKWYKEQREIYDK